MDGTRRILAHHLRRTSRPERRSAMEYRCHPREQCTEEFPRKLKKIERRISFHDGSIDEVTIVSFVETFVTGTATFTAQTFGRGDHLIARRAGGFVRREMVPY